MGHRVGRLVNSQKHSKKNLWTLWLVLYVGIVLRALVVVFGWRFALVQH